MGAEDLSGDLDQLVRAKERDLELYNMRRNEDPRSRAAVGFGFQGDMNEHTKGVNRTVNPIVGGAYHHN